jgi:hypothetical protein
MKDAVASFEDFVKTNIVGRFSWGSFMSAHANAILFSIGSVVFAIWSLANGFRGSFIASGFALLVTSSSLLSLASHTLGVVTRFRLSNGILEFTRFGQGTRRVKLEEIASVLHSDSEPGEAGIWLLDGTTLSLPLLHLLGGRELVTELQHHASVELADEVEQVSARRPHSRQEEAGSWRLIRFHDGTRIKLQVGILLNAEAVRSNYSAESQHLPTTPLAARRETLAYPISSLDTY